MAKASETKNKVFIPVEDRPLCTNRGCKESAQHTGNYRKDGTPHFRKLCSKHHSKKIAKLHGMTSLAEVVAAKQGMTVSQYHRAVLKCSAERVGMTVVDYLNQKHPYRKYRKNYCENRDGRFDFKCRYKIRHSAQLEVDHINGNPKDNREKNLQTLCNNCHRYKTHMNKDYATPGRRALAQKGIFSKLIGK